MDIFAAARDRIEDFASVAPVITGMLTAKHLTKIFMKDWRVSNTGYGEINLHRLTKDGCEYATLTLDGGGLEKLLTQREIQAGVPTMLRKQA